MEGRSFITLVDPDPLSFEERRKSLAAVNITEEKICGKIEGRTCADDIKQNRYIK